MGIQGLLQAVKPLIQPAHLSQFAGQRVAVDAYSWLHKSVYGCCVELCTPNGDGNGSGHSDKWLFYCLSQLDSLLSHRMVVTLVFDGDALPAKHKTEVDRKQQRDSHLAKARDCQARGDHKTARMYFARAVDVTPAMAGALIEVVRATRPGVQCIVAPYEADAQLAFLSRTAAVDLVVSEDSDNIPFGCASVFFKLDREGRGEHLLLSALFASDGDQSYNQIHSHSHDHSLDHNHKEQLDNKQFDLRGWSLDMVRALCVLSGCDYLVRPCVCLFYGPIGVC
jgi:exonuclease 1